MHRLHRARSVLLAVLGVEVAVLVVTGIALWFLYRPAVSYSWNDVLGESYGWDVRMAFTLRLVHRLTSSLALLTSVATGVVVGLGRLENTRRAGAAAVGLGIVFTTFAASFTGFLLPWDQLALWAVTVGSDIRGYGVLFGPTVRFAIVDGVEVSRGTIVLWLLVHSLVVGPGLIGLVALAWRRHRHDREISVN